MSMRAVVAALAAVLSLATSLSQPASAGRPREELPGRLTFTSPQVDPIALSPDGSLLAVAATTSNAVDVISTATNARLRLVPVGVEPVSLAFKPDGSELWVANHVSDSLSVIDTQSASSTFLRVVETIQALDANGVSQFDEPVGIAFASNQKAYVALSSRNQIAVVDAAAYSADPADFITLSAQEPRALTVRNGRLYVAAFESGNQSELSICTTESNTNPQCTLAITDLIAFATNPNIPGEQKNIVADPQVPDRDLFVFDVNTDSQLKVVSGVGTLLYGIAVDASNRVYVTQTDARNTVNGIVAPAGSRQDPNGDGDVSLEDLANRMFTNEVAILDCSVGGSGCTISSVVNLDGGSPAPATALATPYGVAVSANGATVVGTASGTNRLFTMSSAGAVLGRVDVGAIPRGVALRSNPGTGAAETAYVLNTLGNSVSVVNVTNPAAPSLSASFAVGADPTPAAVRAGAIAFHDAFASNTGTFSCASCHPDGNVDQLLWRIGGECFLGGCVADEDEPRTTMPVRGLRDTVPLHWDGSLGDPFGGPDGSTGSGGSVPASCSAGSPHGCFRDLVDASLSGVMCQQPCATGPSGLAGLMTVQQREDMATFLERVSYPPARSRRLDDTLSSTTDPSPPQVGALDVGAREGFEDFFMDQSGGGNPDTCADSNAGCHELPLGTATNSETLQAFEAPTMRGMTDRFLQFSIGPTNAEEIQVLANAGVPFLGVSPLEAPIQWDPANKGFQEITTFGVAFAAFEPVYGVRPLDIFQMFEEASTGFSGALGRQVTLNTRTTNGGLAAATEALLAALEAADTRGVVNLRGEGQRSGASVSISFKDPSYKVGGVSLTRAQLLAEAQAGTLLATLTAQLRGAVTEEVPQPLIAPVGAQCGTGNGATGDPALPTGSSFQLDAAHVAVTHVVFLNGQPTSATIQDLGASACQQAATQRIQISGLTRTGGLDILQIRNEAGLLSNELPLP